LRPYSFQYSLRQALAAHRSALAIFGLALCLRLWGLDFGLPYDLTADEPHYILQALKVGAGEGGPLLRIWHTVGKGGLDYLLFFEYGVVYVVLWLAGRVQEPRDFALLYLQDPTIFYMAGRLTVATLGAATSLLVYGIGRRLYGTRAGLTGAFLAAVTYYHVAFSHIINVHIPMACALWGAVLAFLVFEARRRRGWLLLAGALCGAAIALAYTAGIGLLMLLAALALDTSEARGWRERARDAWALLLATVALVALMSPDLLSGAGLLIGNFSGVLGLADRDAGAPQVRSLIDSVTILRVGNWTGFLDVLRTPVNGPATVAAVIGGVLGFVRRERWTRIFAVATVLFLVIVSLSNRAVSEAYLFPIAPALWLLAGRGLAVLPINRRWALPLATLAVSGVSLFSIVRDDWMIAQPDTREVAKAWMEAHVPSGAKILMDGMRFRFVQGVPLNPDKATIARRLSDLSASELALSDEMLSLYRDAAARVTGPTYELHSTVYGLEVEDVDYYVREAFDYIVISSFDEQRYAAEADKRRYPKSARFYRDVKTDPRLRQVFTIAPALWRRSGPTLTVYAVVPRESATGAG